MQGHFGVVGGVVDLHDRGGPARSACHPWWCRRWSTPRCRARRWWPIVQEVGTTTDRLAWQPDQPAHPASLMKLLTTYAGLDLLGPGWTWRTPV